MKPFNVITLHYFPKKGLKSAGKKTAPPPLKYAKSF